MILIGYPTRFVETFLEFHCAPLGLAEVVFDLARAMHHCLGERGKLCDHRPGTTDLLEIIDVLLQRGAIFGRRRPRVGRGAC